MTVHHPNCSFPIYPCGCENGKTDPGLYFSTAVISGVPPRPDPGEVLPPLDVTPEDIEAAKSLKIDPKLQPDNLTDFGAWWVKLFSWMGGAIKCRERQLLKALRELSYYPAKWREDSSLATWFPLTAEEIIRLKAENAELKAICIEQNLKGIHPWQ